MGIRRWENWPACMGAVTCVGIVLFTAACSQAPAGSTSSRTSGRGTATGAEYQSAARRVLGNGSQVMLSGDLAHDGHIQLLVVNRVPKTVDNAAGDVLVARAAILEKDAEAWREIFLADDHLKNEKGFLQGAPTESVSAWRFQYERGKSGLAMFFTPARQAAGTHSATVEVRWNPRKRRYQSFDRRSSNFLAEAPTVEGVPSYLIKR